MIYFSAYSDVPYFLKADKKHFNKEQFLDIQADADKPFYSKVIDKN